MMIDELVAVSQNRESGDRTATISLQCNLNIIRGLNNHRLMQYWNSCFTEFSKFTHMR